MNRSRCSTARPGTALVLVLWVIVILTGIGTALVIATRSTTSITANYRAGAVARYAAESGVTLAVASLENNLATLGDAGARRGYLNSLDRALGGNAQVVLGDARAAIALIDVGSRLDANLADASSLTKLFSFFTDAIAAESAARAIRGFINGGESPTEPSPSLLAARPLQSLDELIGIPGVPRELVERAAEFLTVDGDGTINRATAPDPVLAAAGGELRDEPSRIVVVSRGWLDGHALTHEIQAVYAIVGSELTLVRWRERNL
jgi:type II secretory pathway component PulK